MPGLEGLRPLATLRLEQTHLASPGKQWALTALMTMTIKGHFRDNHRRPCETNKYVGDVEHTMGHSWNESRRPYKTSKKGQF